MSFFTSRRSRLAVMGLALAGAVSLAVPFPASADDLTLEGVSLGAHVAGPELSAADLEGKIVVFEYWGDRCPPCIASIPHISELREKYGEDQVVIIANQVWTEDVDVAAATWADNDGNADITVINHGSIAEAQIGGVPHAFIFDAEGNQIWEGNPHPRADGVALDETLEAAVEALPEASAS